MQTLEQKLATLPQTFSPYKEALIATQIPYVAITLTPSKTLSLTDSKVGGIGYLPLGQSYPRSKNGDYLHLLAQINLAQTPPLEAYPTEGILQFYISSDDNTYIWGINFENLCDGDIKVIYHEHIGEYERDFTFLKEARENTSLPISKDIELKMDFRLDKSVITAEDFRFEERFGKNYYNFFESFTEQSDTMYEAYQNLFTPIRHQLGGYPTFTQDDPRFYPTHNYPAYRHLLFQLDTDDGENGILWGDAGIGNFFIKPEDLKKRNFADILYTWDCH